jgi:hypothetical protein
VVPEITGNNQRSVTFLLEERCRKNMFYRIIVDSWNDLLLLCDQITDKSSNWAFRGQSDERWNLSTKFEREQRNINVILTGSKIVSR